MDQKYNISDILDAIKEINSSKAAKKFNNDPAQNLKKISNEDIPPSTLKLIEDAEKNLKLS